MSALSHAEPDCRNARSSDVVALEIAGRPRDLGGGFQVRRLLPSGARQMVGPFIFFDEMGPAELPPGQGLDVRPHPHINLATLTYLFEGEIMHRDSLGTAQVIRPGAVNWMTAGRGIVHSERTPASLRESGPRLHGIQLWIALPAEHEEVDPSFEHYRESDIPSVSLAGAQLRVVAGTGFGASSPVKLFSPMAYIDVRLDRGAALELPADHEERALYLVGGSIELGGTAFDPGRMLVLEPRAEARVTARDGARFMILAGEPLEGPRHIFWNFVSSRKERIEEAKQAWRERRFPTVPGDEAERIPLPGE